MPQRPPDLDASGQPLSDKPPDLDATGQPVPSAAGDWPSRYPNAAATARGILNSLPVVGAMVGGAVAGPETLGLGSIPGVALGAGAGKGLRDLGMQGLGLEPATTATEKAQGIASDTAMAAGTQGVFQELPVIASGTKAAVNAGLNALERPGIASTVGAALGYAHGGPWGALEGAVGLGAGSRYLRLLRAAQSGEGPSLINPALVNKVSPRLARSLRIVQAVSKPASGEASAATKGLSIQGVPVDTLKQLGIGDDAIEATLRAQEAASNPIRRPEGVGTLLKMTANVAEKGPAVVEAAKDTAPALAQGAEKLKLSSEELIEGVKMLERGMTPDQALASIKAQREFLTKFKLPSGPEVRAAVTDRNAVGHWADDPVTGHPRWQFPAQPAEK